MNEITEFNKTEAGLADLESRYGTVTDVTTKDGYELNRLGLAELRTTRTTTDKLRKQLGQDARDHINAVNAKAKAIIDRVSALEAPMKAAKQDEDDKVERIKREAAEAEETRIQMIRDAIAAINKIGEDAYYPDELMAAVNELKDIAVTAANFGEFLEAGNMAVETRIDVITERLHRAVVAKEEAEAAEVAKKKAAAAQKKVDEEREKLDLERKEQDAEMKAQQEEMSRQQKELDDAREKQEKAEAAEAERKQEEIDRVAREEAEEKAFVAQQEREAIEAAEEKAREVHEAETRRDEMIANMELYAADAMTVSIIAAGIAQVVANVHSLAVNAETDAGKELMLDTAGDLNSIILKIRNSDVVQSQEGEK